MELINSGKLYDIGMIGLGVMGRNLLFNMAGNGYSVAGYDKDESKVKTLSEEASDYDIYSTPDLDDFLGKLKSPKAVMMLVPAGPPVDSVIREISEKLQPGDLLIDAGNSYFKDTDLRAKALEEKKILYMGAGISGGEKGARFGPSIMPGGPDKAWERVSHLFEAVSATVDGSPCEAHLGPGSAGHFVKMVHNGIEYAMMQLIAETYDLLKRYLGYSDDELLDIFNEWNKGPLSSYLIEITAEIFKKVDERTGKRLIDEILDVARQKGTGMWTSQSALELQVPVPSIDIAVIMRNLSVYEEERQEASLLYPGRPGIFKGDRELFLKQIHDSLYASFIIVFAQGMSLITTASSKYNYNLDPAVVAGIWRGGCIIRASLLEDIMKAYRKNAGMKNMLLDKEFSETINASLGSLRLVVAKAAETGIPVPGFMSVLGYIDAYRSAWLPANLIQAQRDFFGAHTYERIDTKGTFHSDWLKTK